ncbi:hypothetical protein Hanom_Chr11g01020721 [Helianthus anomalus]
MQWHPFTFELLHLLWFRNSLNYAFLNQSNQISYLFVYYTHTHRVWFSIENR